jgi:predicted lipoprotein
VRPIEKDGAGQFDAVRYVDSIWTSRVVSEPSLINGEGRVTRVEVGQIVLDNGIALLGGPVIRGTALRDALPFIQFSQFTNQLEYARVSNALNDRAVKVAESAHVKAGDTVRYAGAGSKDGVVPVMLEVR